MIHRGGVHQPERLIRLFLQHDTVGDAYGLIRWCKMEPGFTAIEPSLATSWGLIAEPEANAGTILQDEIPARSIIVLIGVGEIHAVPRQGDLSADILRIGAPQPTFEILNLKRQRQRCADRSLAGTGQQTAVIMYRTLSGKRINNTV